MINIKKIRKEFPMLQSKTQQGHPLCYLDNAATTFKPFCVIKACDEYYLSENANAHRGDYDLAYKVDIRIDKTREAIAKFINAKKQEIVFTSGTSMSINMVAFGYGLKFLKPGDEILLTEAEHASNVLPWFKVAEMTGAKIKYIPLTKSGRLLPNALKKVLNEKTKVVSVAQVTNVLGFQVDIKGISEIVHSNSKAIVLCDGAQSVPHIKVDVKDLDCDFLCFSGHKMCGPTGIGVLYGKYELLKIMDPLMSGGGDNARFDMCGNVAYLEPPAKFEAGTMNIEGIYGFGPAIDFINSIGIENINAYEKKLRRYAIKKLKTLDNIIIYNEKADSGIITLNVKNVFAQDEASYLNSKGICVRSGEHCAKLLKKRLGVIGTVRVSLYFYNTKQEIDALYEALKTGGDFLDAYFN